MSRDKCDKCKRPVIVARNVSGAVVLLDPAPVLIYWLDRADCGTLAQRADDVKYYAPHRCDAPVGSLPARRLPADVAAPNPDIDGGKGMGRGRPGIPRGPDRAGGSPFAQFVRSRRRALGWTQRALAAACDLSPQTIRHIETDGARANDVTLRHLARGLGIELRELIAAERPEGSESDAA